MREFLFSLQLSTFQQNTQFTVYAAKIKKVTIARSFFLKFFFDNCMLVMLLSNTQKSQDLCINEKCDL